MFNDTRADPPGLLPATRGCATQEIHAAMNAYTPKNDDSNPRYMFSTTPTELLAAIMQGQVSVSDYVAKELANRGLNDKGEWVGFDKAHELLKDYFEFA